MASSLTMKTLVAVFVLATLAIEYNEAQHHTIDNIRRKLRSMQPGHRAGYGDPNAQAASRARAYGAYPAAAGAPYRHSFPRHGPVQAHGPASAAAAASAAANPHGYAPSSYVPLPPPVSAPMYSGYAPQPAYHHHQPVYQPPSFEFSGPQHARRYHKYPTRVHASHPGGAAATSAAAAAGNGGAAAAGSAAGASGGHGGHGGSAAANAQAAVNGGHAHGYANPHSHVVEEENYSEHYNDPETDNVYAAQTGTYANDGQGRESSSYVRATENVENHEDGNENDNHYYNAQSYGKTYDENDNESYENNDENIQHTPNLFHKTSSKTNYKKSSNKAHRESGSGVVAHDKHQASYNKNFKKFNENVDSRFNKEGAGASDAEAFSSAVSHEDSDEHRFDSDNLGDFVGVDGHVHHKHPGFINRAAGGAAASGSATSDGNGAGVATSSAAVGNGQAASSGSAGRR